MNYLKCNLMLALVVLLAACSSNASPSESGELLQKIAELESQVEALQAELNEKNELLPGGEQASESQGEVAAAADPTNAIELSSAVTVPDFAEITMLKVDFTSKVSPPKPGSFYTYYEVKDPAAIFLDTVVAVKSLLTSSKRSDEFAEVAVIYDGKYEYRSFSTIEESGGADFTYTNITGIEPLKTGTLHFIAELPKEAAEDDKSIEIVLTANGEEYVYKLR